MVNKILSVFLFVSESKCSHHAVIAISDGQSKIDESERIEKPGFPCTHCLSNAPHVTG